MSQVYQKPVTGVIVISNNKQISLHKAIIKNEEKEIEKHNKEITRLKDELMRLETEQMTFL